MAHRGLLTDRSGSVTTGGTSQTLAVANNRRRFLYIQNPITATETLFINFTTAASTSGVNSVELGAGASFTMTEDTFISVDKITVTAATSAHKYIAKEGE